MQTGYCKIGWDTWNNISVNRFFVLNRNTLNHMTVCRLLCCILLVAIINRNNTYTNTNAGTIHRQKPAGRCCFRYERFINFLTSDLWHEERDTILTMLTSPPRAAHLVVFTISIHLRRSRPESLTAASTLENSTLWLHGPISTDSFQNPQILRTFSSGHDIIHIPAPFPLWGFIMTMVIVISVARER